MKELESESKETHQKSKIMRGKKKRILEQSDLDPDLPKRKKEKKKAIRTGQFNK